MAKTWKQIEVSRNRRLWITDVIVPVVGGLTTIAVIAQAAGYDVIGKAKDVGSKVKDKFSKK